MLPFGVTFLSKAFQHQAVSSCIKLSDIISFSYISIGLSLFSVNICVTLSEKRDAKVVWSKSTSTGRPSEVQCTCGHKVLQEWEIGFGLDRLGLLTPMESQTGTLTMMVVDPKNILKTYKHLWNPRLIMIWALAFSFYDSHFAFNLPAEAPENRQQFWSFAAQWRSVSAASWTSWTCSIWVCLKMLG